MDLSLLNGWCTNYRIYIIFFFKKDTNLDYSFLDSSASLLWNSCTEAINLYSNKAIRATDNFEQLAQDFVIFYKAFSRFTILIQLCMYKKRLCTKSEISSRKGIPMFHFWLEDGGVMCQEMWTGSKCTEQTLTLSQQGINDHSSITTTNWILPTTKMNLEGGFPPPLRTSRWQFSPVHTLISVLWYPKKRI